MTAGKRERLDEFLRRLERVAPFHNYETARLAVSEILTQVEDEMTDIPANLAASSAPADGRMYPPHDDFEVTSPSKTVKRFRLARHYTNFGMNGSVLIVGVDGVVEIDLPGTDGRTVGDLCKVEISEK